ncbi:class I SAM-dependent methyltransferase [Lachnospiraceae bacterium 47-T17]
MHKSTMLRMEWFINHYIKKDGAKVLDVGSYDVNGSYKSLFEGKNVEYVGLDIVEGPNVDVVMHSPYSWSNLKDEDFDYIISGQAFEHIEFPWLTIQEIYKKLKPGGMICIIAPNSTPEHRYPTDCYRYFADGFAALAKWGGFTVLDVTVAGIPERSAPPEWESGDNDVCLIASKGSVDLPEGERAGFPFERRLSEALDLKLRYDFMYRWIETPDKNKIFQKYFAENGIKTVYIYGCENLGKLLYKEITEIVDLEVCYIESDQEKIPFKSNSLMLVSILDSNRDLILYLDRIWKDVPKCYIDDWFIVNQLRDFLDGNKEKYIYGAGYIGKRLLGSLERFGYQIDGFIVSDGRKADLSLDHVKIFELGELRDRKEIGIIVAVVDKYKDEILNLLEEEKHKNYIVF